MELPTRETFILSDRTIPISLVFISYYIVLTLHCVTLLVKHYVNMFWKVHYKWSYYHYFSLNN